MKFGKFFAIFTFVFALVVTNLTGARAEEVTGSGQVSGSGSGVYCALAGCTMTGSIVVPLGTGNATSIQATGNPGTGLYFWNSTNFALCQNSNCRLQSNGSVLDIYAAELLSGSGVSCGTLTNGYACATSSTTNGLILQGSDCEIVD